MKRKIVSTFLQEAVALAGNIEKAAEKAGADNHGFALLVYEKRPDGLAGHHKVCAEPEYLARMIADLVERDTTGIVRKYLIELPDKSSFNS